mgnify:CR=1 FL=1
MAVYMEYAPFGINKRFYNSKGKSEIVPKSIDTLGKDTNFFFLIYDNITDENKIETRGCVLYKKGDKLLNLSYPTAENTKISNEIRQYFENKEKEEMIEVDINKLISEGTTIHCTTEISVNDIMEAIKNPEVNFNPQEVIIKSNSQDSSLMRVLIGDVEGIYDINESNFTPIKNNIHLD